MFPPAIWNVHDATVNGDARTNNMCEGWHLFGRNAYTAVPVTSLNGTRTVYSCLNGCGGTEKVPSMKMKKVWALANLSKLSGE
jgi:hypothetical protein